MLNRKSLLELARKYSKYDKTFFQNDDRFRSLAGYKLIEDGDIVHLCFTNKWSMPDFLLDAATADKTVGWLKDAGIQESAISVALFDKVLQRAVKCEELGKLVDFRSVALSGCTALQMPGGIHFNNAGILPSLPFMDETPYWMKADATHYVLYTYDGDFRLHICPMHIKEMEKWSIGEVHDRKKKEEPTGFGLFF